jgi:hypothetical protein
VRAASCQIAAEGVVSKLIDQPYAPGNRGIWIKAKCLNRQEFVVVGWTEGEGSRKELGSLLLGYYDGKRLVYAGCVSAGITQREMGKLRRRLEQVAIDKMPLAEARRRDSRFGRSLELRKVRWVRPQLVAEVTFLTRAADGLLRQVPFQGLREDKRAREVRLEGRSVMAAPSIEGPRSQEQSGLIASRYLYGHRPIDDFKDAAGSHQPRFAARVDVVLFRSFGRHGRPSATVVVRQCPPEPLNLLVAYLAHSAPASRCRNISHEASLLHTPLATLSSARSQEHNPC